MSTPTIGTMSSFAPGWHEKRPMSEYLGDPAAGASQLWKLHTTTPAHFLEELRAGRASTRVQELGSLLHARIFEPETLERYVTLDRCEARVKTTGERCANQGTVYRDGQSFCGVKGHDPYGKDIPMEPGLEIVTASQQAEAVAMEASLRAHYSVGQILAAPGPREVIGVWQDRETGLWLRIRPDHLIEGPDGTAPRWHWSNVNLKSTSKVARGESFRRDFENLGNHFKAAFYRMGFRELWDVEPQNFWYPTVESYPPFAVVLNRLHEDWMDIAEDDVRHTLRLLAECIEADQWPAYGPEVHDVNLPEWRRKRLQVDELDVVEVAA
jgi:exodeoxyribonuclease VIII